MAQEPSTPAPGAAKQTTPQSDPNTHLGALFAAATRMRGAWVTAPVVNTAAKLLAEVDTASTVHGVTLGDWGTATDLPTLTLFAVCTSTARRCAEMAEDAPVQLIRRVAAMLTSAGLAVVGKPNDTSLAMGSPPPGEERPLRLSCTTAHGWVLGFDSTSSPTIMVYAPYDNDGANAVADLLRQLCQGTLRPPWPLGGNR